MTSLTMNFGPQHPAAHGVLRLVMEIDGEVRWERGRGGRVCERGREEGREGGRASKGHALES